MPDETMVCRFRRLLEARWPDFSMSQEPIGTVSAEPTRTRTTRANVAQRWLFSA